MFNDRLTIAISIILVISGILIYTSANFEFVKEKKYGDYTPIEINIDDIRALDFKLRDGQVTSLNKENNDVIMMMIIRSKICHPCINNIIDYQNLLKNEDFKNVQAFILFKDSLISDSERFVNFVGLTLPYTNISIDSLPVFKSYEQALIFIDPLRKKIILRRTIPGNNTTSVSDKINVINAAKNLMINPYSYEK